MIPLVDTHCHLLAGLDDGPATSEEAMAMCRLAWEEGIRVVAATAHMGELWPANTPRRIRSATNRLSGDLEAAGLQLTVYPAAEVMIRPELDIAWRQGTLLGMSGGSAYLLVELPLGLFFDISDMVRRFADLGVRTILAHPERHPELLHGAGTIEELIALGCLVQVASESIVQPGRREDVRAIKKWIQRGVVHLIGTDGHSPAHRPPQMAAAYRQIASWAGNDAADRICSIHGLMVLEGLSLRTVAPKPSKRFWFSRC